MTRSDLSAGEAFADVAARYLDLVGENHGPELTDLDRLAALIAELVSRAVMLPDVAATDSRPAARTTFRCRQFPAVLYWSLLDPLTGVERADPPTPGLGDLADDLADIAADLARGLDAWRETSEDGRRRAIWEWRFSFRTHWGAHATSALPVLLRL